MAETVIGSVRHDLGFSTELVKVFVMDLQILESNMAEANCFDTVRPTPGCELAVEKVSASELVTTVFSLEQVWDCRSEESTNRLGSEVTFRLHRKWSSRSYAGECRD